MTVIEQLKFIINKYELDFVIDGDDVSILGEDGKEIGWFKDSNVLIPIDEA